MKTNIPGLKNNDCCKRKDEFDTMDVKIEDVVIPFDEVTERLNYLSFLIPFHTLANLILVFGCKFGGRIFISYLRRGLADDFGETNSIEGEPSKYA